MVEKPPEENPPEPVVENPPPAAEPAPESAAPQTKARAPELKNPSRPGGLRYRLFSRETRFGRFLRFFARGLVVIVGLLGLGVLATYLLVYRPAAQQLTALQVQATQTAGDLNQARQSLTQTQQDLKNNQAQLTKLQNQLDVELARNQILRVNAAVVEARAAVTTKDKAAAAKALSNADTLFQKAQPTINKYDPAEVSVLQALFVLAKNDLDRNLTQAGQDLDRIQAELKRVDTTVLK